MNFLKEVEELAKKGVFINYGNEHYKDGSNCNFQVEFVEDGEKKYATAWWGDNHEFGDVHEAMKASVMMAKWLAEDEERKYNYFTCARETVSEDGHERWKLHRKTNQELMDYMYENHPPYKKSSDDGKKFMEEYSKKDE